MVSADIVDIVNKSIAEANQRELAIKHKQAYSISVYRQQFRTVRLQFPRATGHTTAAIRLVTQYPKSIYVSPTEAQRQNVFRRDETVIKSTSKLKLFSHSMDFRELKDISLIVIDDASKFSDVELDMLYQQRLNDDVFFVLLN